MLLGTRQAVVERGFFGLVKGRLLGGWVADASFGCDWRLRDVAVFGFNLALFSGLRDFEVDAIAAFR